MNTTLIIEAACECAGCTLEQFYSKTRLAEVVLARHMTAYAMRLGRYTYKEIAETIGYTNHDMAIYSVRRIINSLFVSKSEPQVTQIRKFIGMLSIGHDGLVTGSVHKGALVITGNNMILTYCNHALVVMDQFGGFVDRVQNPNFTIADIINKYFK